MTRSPGEPGSTSGPVSSEQARRLGELISNRSARVGVVGLGYVGLPLAGFDTDPTKPELLASGESYLKHIPAERIRGATGSSMLEATIDLSRLGEADAVLICVPTPLTPEREPDMRFVRSTLDSVAATLREGQLVVLESTTYPGTTEELARQVLDEKGLGCGSAYFLAFSPEREDPGNPDYGTRDIPKLVGGVDTISGELAEALYGAAFCSVVRVSSARVAEAAKLLENVFRAVNIALVNELKMAYDRMGIDIWEVLDAAETKPFGFMRFNPGPGWGGHCIPVDPFYLSWKARQHGFAPRFIELAGEINRQMPDYVIEKLDAALRERGKPLTGSKILLLGLAYKRDIDDTRESPALELLERLADRGVDIEFHDPFVRAIPPTRRHSGLAGLRACSLDPETLAAMDAVLLVTDHSDIDYSEVLKHARLVVDTRGILRSSLAAIVRA
jgi:UDP-N-acetyl-D-glucosamine dehydrogenase